MKTSLMMAAACVTFALIPSAKADPRSLNGEPPMEDPFDSYYSPTRVNPEFIGQRGRVLGRHSANDGSVSGSSAVDSIGAGSVVVRPGARVLGPIINMPVIGAHESPARR